MHLKSLTLKGFKSFASSTTLKFEPGICAVVGPNGSGKSNVVDALAWVMGEQGAKTLRGGKMEDVIFAGAGDRKPLGRAEVTLTIDNSDGALPIDYTEVSVTRRMFRDGASEYEINGAKARLMDIQELLSDSGIGREMHVIVGQGRLASILEARPEDRRAFIEEAAGVLKHRRRKEKAQRKLVSMQANLDRLQDLTGELSKQLKPLARQAEAASKAATVQAELRQARLELAADKLRRLRAAVATAQEKHDAAAARIADVEAHAHAAQDRRDELDTALSALAPQAEAAHAVFFDLSALAERVGATARIASDRARNHAHDDAYQGPDPAQLKARAEHAAATAAELGEEVRVAQARLDDITEQVELHQDAADAADKEHLANIRAIADRREGVVRLIAAEESLNATLSQAREDLRAAEEHAAEAAEQLRASDTAIAEAEDELATAQAGTAPHTAALEAATADTRAAQQRLDEVRAEEREAEREASRLESRIDTLAAQAPRAAAEKLLGESFTSLSHAIDIEPDKAAALAAALGPAALALIGPLNTLSPDTLADAACEKTVLIDSGDHPLPSPATTNDADNAEDAAPKTAPDDSATTWNITLDQELPEGCSWLHTHLTLRPAAQPLARLISDVVYAPTLEAARAATATDERLRAVTPTGQLVGAGWLTLGAGSPTPVDVAGAIAAATTQLHAVRARLADQAGTLAGAQEAAAAAALAHASAQAAAHEHDLLVQQAASKLRQARSAAEAAARAHEHATTARDKAAATLAATEEELAATRERLDRVEDSDEPDEELARRRDEAHLALSQIKAMEMEARLSVRTAEERAQQASRHADNLARQATQEQAAYERHTEAVKARARAAHLAATVAELAETISQRLGIAIAQAQENKEALAEEKKELAEQLEQAKERARVTGEEYTTLSRTVHEAELSLGAAQVRLEQVESSIVDSTGLSCEVILAEHTPDADFDQQAASELVKKLERRLSALGKVNPLALEEYKALQERYDFLATQLADVEQARKDLRQVIDDVDDMILTLFTQAWEDVRDAFPEVFSTLFPGGQGRLELTDPQDMLTTGIEVHARPPGKRVTRLSLLSGGEKSLTALALLVAIFKARPSPFYVMDEVEAALDDVNLRRLINLFEQLRASSQLIVITHQKPTMDVANVLYGVTMRGDGVTRVISQRMNPVTSTAPVQDAGPPGD